MISPVAVSAAEENRFSVGAAISTVVPNEKALFGDAVHVDTAYMPELNLTYFMTKAWSLELAQGWYKTTLKDKDLGATMGDLTVAPLRLTLQYRYNDGKIASYYVGGGIGYFFTSFDTADAIRNNPFVSDPTLRIKTKDAFGSHLGGGFDYFLAQSLALNLDLKYWFAQSDAKIQGKTINRSDNYHLDSFSAGLGLKLFF